MPSFVSELEAVTEDLVPFLDGVERCYGKPLLAGHSQGGAVALLLALRYPDLVRGAVVASTSLPRDLWERFGVPVTILHGTDDPIVSRQGVVAMGSATGAEIVLVEG